MNAKPSKKNWSQIMKDSYYPMSKNVGFVLNISTVPLKINYYLWFNPGGRNKKGKDMTADAP